MRIAIEGPAIPELRNRNSADADVGEFMELLDEAYRQWMKKPRRINWNYVQKQFSFRVN